MSEDRPSPHEVVIVRRRGGGHEDGHHGGAWKIAFADFMTALMCFFLVMWLINSTDKKTVAQIASYFNPLKLNDRQPSQKGVHDSGASSRIEKTEKHQKKNPKTAVAEQGEPLDEREPSDRAAGEPDDQEILRDPYASLERITASEAPVDALASVAASRIDEQVLVDPLRSVRRVGPAQGPQSAPGNDAAQISGQIAQRESQMARSQRPHVPAEQRVSNQETEPAEMQSAKLRREILAAVADIKAGSKPDIDVVEEKTAIVVSLTDEFDFGMFKVGSASPSRELILVMERIAKVLGKTHGRISLRGHTDGRQYQSQDRDNWRLSMARAQIALYMLVRGGISETRIDKLEGHADRALKTPSDPTAASNRRIEILIEKEP